MSIRHIAILFICIFAEACSVTAIRKHEPNFKNVRELQKVKGTFYVSEIGAKKEEITKHLNDTSLSCRLTTFNMPANKKVKDFIYDALTDELDAAEKMNKNGKKISIQVVQLESSTGSFNKGSWTLDFLYNVGGKSFSVQSKTEFESAYMADTACRNTANALTDALSENFIKLYSKLQ